MTILNSYRLLSSVIMATLLSGCATTYNPLVFVDKNELGIAMKGGATGADAGLTLGYNSASVAVVPTESTTGTDIRNGQDALSVFASFGTRGSISNREIKVTRIFATGVAAIKAAEKVSDIPVTTKAAVANQTSQLVEE